MPNKLLSPHHISRILIWADLIRSNPNRRWTETDSKVIGELMRLKDLYFRQKYEETKNKKNSKG